MKKSTKKRGQKLTQQLAKLSEDGREHLRVNFFERVSHIKQIRLLVLEWALLVLTITLLAVTQGFWYAQSYAATAYTRGGTYTEATLGKVSTLNPLFATTSSEKTLSRLMFATLSAVDYSGHSGLGLASSITTDDSGEVWSIKLRDGIKWSDGQPITAADVLYTVKMIQSSAINTSYSGSLSGVTVKEAGDRIEFTLPTAYASFASVLNFPILPSHILGEVQPAFLLENNFSISPVTSGAFTYNATQTIGSAGEKIVYLSPNKSYYGGQPMLDSFAVHAFVSTDDIVNALNAGSVTASADLLPTDKDRITSASIYERQSAISSGVFAFLNMRDGVLRQQSLRKALQEGLDMRSLRAPLGEESPLDYPLLPNQVELKDYPDLPAYDPDAAKEAIQAANLSEDTKVRIATVNSGYLPALAENLKYQLDNLGLKAEVSVSEMGQDFLMGVLRPRNYDILIYEVELGADPDLLPYYHSSQATETGFNLSNYTNSLASDLLLGARSTMDEELRAAKYESFLRYWVNDVPAIGIYQVNMSYYVNKNVRSFSQDDRLVTPTDRFCDVTFWATEQVTKNRTP